MKRRARVQISAEALKELLMLPGDVLDARAMPPYIEHIGEECSYVEFKLDGPDLPEVPEGSLLPVITIIVEFGKAYWMQEGDDEGHFIREITCR